MPTECTTSVQDSHRTQRHESRSNAGDRREHGHHWDVATGGRTEHVELLEGRPQHGARAATEPAIEHRGIQRTEVDAGHHSVPPIKPSQTWLSTVQTTPHRRADEEVIVGSAVIGATGVVRPTGATELAVGHDRHPRAVLRQQRGEEQLQCGVEVTHQPCQVLRLAGVVVESVLARVDHPHSQVGVDQPSHHCQLLRQVIVRKGVDEDRRHLLPNIDDALDRCRNGVVPRPPPRRCACEVPHALVHPLLLAVIVVVRVATKANSPLRNRDASLVDTDEMQRETLPHGCRTKRVVAVEAVQPTPHPAAVGYAVAGPAVHPQGHRGEVAEVGVWVSNALHDCDLAGVVERLEVGQVGVQTDLRVQVQRLVCRNCDIAVLVVIETVGVRHNDVETVAATELAHQNQDPFVVTDRCGGERLAQVTRKQVGGEGLAEATHHRSRANAPAHHLQEPSAVHAEPVGSRVGNRVGRRNGEQPEGVGGGDIWVDHSSPSFRPRGIQGSS